MRQSLCLLTLKQRNDNVPQGDGNDGEVGGEGEHGEQSQEVVYHLQQQAILPISNKNFSILGPYTERIYL